MLGKFTSLPPSPRFIHALIPASVPTPHGWEREKSKVGSPDTHFFLCDVVDMRHLGARTYPIYSVASRNASEEQFTERNVWRASHHVRCQAATYRRLGS